MKPKKLNLKNQVEENTTVTRKKSLGGTETLKSGKPLDHEQKHQAHKCACATKSNEVVGVSLGITKNMDNYESLRVDCWLSDEVQEGETKKEALKRLTEIAEVHLEEVALKYID